MGSDHWILLLLWIFYCVIHSILANITVKKTIESVLGRSFIYYRLFYSIFATVTLALLVWHHFSLTSPLLFQIPFVNKGLSFVLIIPGIIIMGLCIRKYFYELSGIQSLTERVSVMTLQQKGLHGVVRHPLYLGTLLFVWGLFLMFPYLNNLLACLVVHGYVLIGIMIEEKKLMIEFGENYRDYAAKIPRLLPRWKVWRKK